MNLHKNDIISVEDIYRKIDSFVLRSKETGSRYYTVLCERLLSVLEQLPSDISQGSRLEVSITEMALCDAEGGIVRLWPEQSWIPFLTFQALVPNVKQRKKAWKTPGWILEDMLGCPSRASLSATLWLMDQAAGVHIPGEADGIVAVF